MSSSIQHAAHAASCACPDEGPRTGEPAVMVVRTGRGWSVLSPGRADDVGDLVEGFSLADLVAEELGAAHEPDRTARRAARGPGTDAQAAASGDPRDARLAALERTVAQLEHALAARVSTERAIGVLAERHGTSPRAAFELLRGQARSTGRPVHELAREVLDGLGAAVELPAPAAAAEATPAPLPPAPRSPSGPSPAEPTARTDAAVPADGRS